MTRIKKWAHYSAGKSRQPERKDGQAMTSKGSRYSNLIHSLKRFRLLSLNSLARAYALRLVLISAFSLSIPAEIESADSLTLATITICYALIEAVCCVYALSHKLNTESKVRFPELTFVAALWLSTLWLSLLAFSYAVLSSSLVVYDRPINYALEAVLLASLIMETRACLRQKPAF